jgi:iron complex outermembrane receptor protein
MSVRLHKSRLTPIALAVVTAITTLPVLAQSSEPVTQITITGTNIKRTEVETASPIQTITAKEIEQSGAKTVLELLKEVTSAGVGGYFDTSDQNGFSRGVATASLRNFGSTNTLILLNGRRLAPSAFVNPNTGQSTLYDLNSIPISALDRVEVLKDGASAVYGSDAIAGVINFITRSDFEGKTVSISAGANDSNDFGSQNVNLAFGFGDLNKDKYNLLVALDITKRGQTMASQITDARTDEYAAINFRLNPYNTFASSSAFIARETSPGAFSSANRANWVNQLNCSADRQITGAAVHGISTASTLFGRTFCNYPTYTRTQAQSPGLDSSLLMVGTLNLGSSMTAFSEFAITQSNREYLALPIAIDGRAPVTNFILGGTAPSFQALLPIGHPDNPFPTSRAAAIYRFEDLKSETHLTNTSSRLLAGVRGTAGKWDYESAVLWNRSERDETRYGALYLPTLRKLVTENRTLASLSTDPNLSVPINTLGSSEILQFDAKASTSLGKLPGGPIGFAAGVEVRDEKLSLLPDANVSTGLIYGTANQVIDAKRQVVSAFAELRAPLTKTLEAELAGRFDKYPGIAANFVPKFGAKWIADPNYVAFRGTYSKGFRAPAVSQTAPGGAQFFTSGVDPIRCPDGVTPVTGADTTDCNKSFSGTGGANPDLKPETSKNLSLGMIITPNKDNDILFDLFRVTQYGEVDLSSSDFILRNPTNFPADYISRASTNLLTDTNGNPIPGTGPLLAVKLPWTNIGSTLVHGFDVEFRNRYRVAPGSRLTSTLRFTQLLKYARSEAEGNPSYNSVGTSAGINDWSINTGSMPKFRSTLSVAYDTPDHTFVVGARHVSSVSLIRKYDADLVYPVPYCQYGVAPPAGTPYVYQRYSNLTASANALYSQLYPDCRIQSWTTMSFGYSYKGLKNTVMSVNVQNITDKKAPYSPTTGSGDIAHNNTLHNATGRYIRASMRYSF